MTDWEMLLSTFLVIAVGCFVLLYFNYRKLKSES